MPRRAFAWKAPRTEHLLWPLGGVGAPLLAISGCGGVERISSRHRPDIRGASNCFAALSFPGSGIAARVLEGPVPRSKAWPGLTRDGWDDAALGHLGGYHHGLPRMESAEFTHRFPLAEVALRQRGWPVTATLRAWSPFIPGDADASGMPVAALTWSFRNPGKKRVRALFSFNLRRDLLHPRGVPNDGQKIRRTARGVAVDYPALPDKPWTVGGLAAELDGAMADCAWFRGSWFDAMSAAWTAIEHGRAREQAPHVEGDAGSGATLWLPLDIAPGATAEATVRLAWHEPVSEHRIGMKDDPAKGPRPTYVPHYATRFASVDAVAAAFHAGYAALERRTRAFADALHESDLPDEALEAVTANLPILRSPTVLRQHDGRLWGWEGCQTLIGSCHGSCTHVWNYAQALAHLFPSLERSLRETEFGENQDATGHQNFRAWLPIEPLDHDFHAAADGQLGGIVKVWREWQISGDGAWLKRLWPRVRKSLEYCISAWDPDRVGALIEPHHNTYDIEFWGPDGMCGSIYASALKAAAEMSAAVGEDPAPWRALLAKAVKHLERELFKRGRFVQRVMRSTPRTGDVVDQKATWSVNYSAEAKRLVDSEGPKYQYGEGCIADGVIGAWMADAAGLGSPLAPAKVRSHLKQLHRHNLRRDLRDHACPQRPGFAFGDEGGLLLCTWPDGGKPTLPFVYSDEVWTGIEYQVASHCIMAGLVDEGLEIVRVARGRYDGAKRNPFDEYECGHWYARALASWALVPALSGLRYSAVEKTLWIAPAAKRRPYRAFIGAGGAFGTLTLGTKELTIALAEGSLAIERVVVDGKAFPWSVTVAVGAPATLALGKKAPKR